MKKTVLITGTSKGIGKALTLKLLENNYLVIGTSRNEDEQTIFHENFYKFSLDLSNEDSITKTHQAIFSKFPSIDILINNVGIGPDLDSTIPEINSFNTTFQTNVTGTVFFTEPIIEKISTNGLILNVSSKMGSINRCHEFDSVAYRMSKSAINMYTKILENRLKESLTVAAIHPGYVRTTIAKSNVNGRLSAQESAKNIFDFIESNFSNGIFWDSENREALPW